MIRGTHLKVNRLYSPNSLTPGKVTFSWCVEGGLRQSAFSLKIYKENILVYKSGIIESDEQTYTPEFVTEGGGKWEWTLELYDENHISDSICRGEFGTVLKNSEWHAKWIDPEPMRKNVKKSKKNFISQTKKLIFKKEIDQVRYPATYLKKTFYMTEKQLKQQNRLYITAHGLYTVWINGKKLEDWVLAPGCTQYDSILNVQCYEITEYLKENQNDIEVCLTDGWYRGSMNNERDLNTFGADVALLCEFRTGKDIVFISDRSWMATKEGPLGLNDLQLGEYYNATKSLETAKWYPVEEKEYSFDNLTGSDCQPIKEKEYFAAKLIITPNGDKVLDFGQNFAGYVRMEFEANGNEQFILTHGETLDKNGNFTQKNILAATKPNAYQQVFYKCKAGVNRYQPISCFFGFRYVKVDTSMDLSPEWFTGVAVYSDMEQTAEFTCGNEKVNQLFSNCLWSMKSNFLGIMTDCPTRERSGYTGDGQVFCPSGLYLMDCYPVYLSWLKSLRHVFLPDGGLKMFAPEKQPGSFMDSSHGWCDAIVIIPYLMWKRSGDINILHENYSSAKRWIDFALKRAASKTGRKGRRKLPKELQKYYADQGFCWGEWLEAKAENEKASFFEGIKHIIQGEPETATAYLSYSCRLLSEMADALEKKEDAEYYKNASEMSKNAYRVFYTQEGIIQEEQRQCRYVRPMALDILEEDEKLKAVGQLVELIKKNNNHLNTGFLSTAYLCRMLSDYGEEKQAYDLLLQETFPSWLYEVNKGATTIWENWNGIDEDGNLTSSFNHYSLGAISGWLMDSVCGIRVECGKIQIMPKTDSRLDYVEGVYDAPFGKIISKWKYANEKIIFSFVIPAGKTAKIILPNGEMYNCDCGCHEFVIARNNL